MGNCKDGKCGLRAGAVVLGTTQTVNKWTVGVFDEGGKDYDDTPFPFTNGLKIYAVQDVSLASILAPPKPIVVEMFFT